MEDASCIEQKGVIEKIENGLAKVNVTSFSACAHCHSKNACDLSNSSSKIIKVPLPDTSYRVGELVQIIMKRSLGIRAAFLAYILPFLLVILLLLILTTLHFREWVAGLISLFLLIPYFLGLYLFRERLERTFTFTIRKAG